MKRLLSLSIAAILLSAAGVRAAIQIPDTVLDSVAAVQAEDIASQNGIETAETALSEAVSANEMWDRANTLYMNGEFAAAANVYERILGEGLFSDKLYYNLANACFRTGENTKAILYYNRALLLAPNDEDIRHNLAIAESQIKDNIEEVPEFFLKSWTRSVRNMLDESTWTIISLAMLAAVLALLVTFMLSHSTAARKGSFFGIAAAALLCIIATSFATSQRRAMLNRDTAIVMSTSASVKSSPDRSATDLFVLHEGTKVRILETLDRWSEIVIADGKKGWIESDKIERI